MLYVISSDVAWREVAGELFIITPDGLLHGISSKAGPFIWRQIEQGSQRNEVLAALCDKFEVDAATAAKDLDEFLDSMVEKGLLSAQTDA